MTDLEKRMLPTLGNRRWIARNEAKLRELLPETWTNMNNLNVVKIAFNLKLLGIEWQSNDEFGAVMAFLEKLGILQRAETYLVRRNPRIRFESTEEPIVAINKKESPSDEHNV